MDMLMSLPDNLAFAVIQFLPTPPFLNELKTECSQVCGECEFAFHLKSCSFLCVDLGTTQVVAGGGGRVVYEGPQVLYVCSACLNQQKVVEKLRVILRELRWSVHVPWGMQPPYNFLHTHMSLVGPELFECFDDDDDDAWDDVSMQPAARVLRFPSSRQARPVLKVKCVESVFGPFRRWPPRVQNFFPLVCMHDTIRGQLTEFRECLKERNWGFAASCLEDARTSVNDMKAMRSVVADESLAQFDDCITRYEAVVADCETEVKLHEEMVIFMSTMALKRLKEAVAKEDLASLGPLLTSVKEVIDNTGRNFSAHSDAPCVQLKKTLRAAEEFYSAATARAAPKRARIV